MANFKFKNKAKHGIEFEINNDGEWIKPEGESGDKADTGAYTITIQPKNGAWPTDEYWKLSLGFYQGNFTVELTDNIVVSNTTPTDDYSYFDVEDKTKLSCTITLTPSAEESSRAHVDMPAGSGGLADFKMDLKDNVVVGDDDQ